MSKLFITPLAILFVILSLAAISTEESLAQGGCCRTPDNAFCLGCDSNCAATENLCESLNGIFIGSTQACVSEFGDCGSLPDGLTGCCLGSEGICSEAVTYDECFGGGGQFWSAGQCSTTTFCARSNIPTMSEWGLIATSLVLGVAGAGYIVIRRRRASEM